MTSWRNQTGATACESPLYAARLCRSQTIFEYIDRRNPRGAREVKTFIGRRIAQLGDAPVRHRTIAGLDVRALYLGRHPYIVYVDQDEISIVHIRHAAQRPWQGEGE
jgi:plasmid stabilization system protein ParE